jgi:acyl-CoA synthetase (AMP-forming)/AMP-acid ligase II
MKDVLLAFILLKLGGVSLLENMTMISVFYFRGPMSHLTAGKDCLIGVLPFYHIYGMVVVQFGSLCLGTKLVALPRFEPEPFLSAIQQHKVRYFSK